MKAMGPADRKCPRCAASIAPLARFCPACGLPFSRLTPGETLDSKYEILDKIGEGGMGEVYRARHVHLDEIRIIKVTKPGALADDADPRRFQEEARIATLVRHPNVAALYDFSRQPDGSYYMVWEFIDGVTLETWLARRGPLELENALDVARQVLAGLAEIHAQGIVHRDLSPDNIMLRETGGGRLQAKIIDLGIAKRVAAKSLEMTSTGIFLGKLKYCSPEQAGALPEGQTVDGRSDLYTFGVVLFEMLTGKAPFESSTPEGYIGKHLHAAPAPLDVSGMPRDVGPALSAAVTKALEKKRERRYQDADEFSDALARLLPAALGADRAPATQPRRRRVAPAGIAAVLLVAAAAGTYSVLRRRSAPPTAPASHRGTPPARSSPPAPRPTPPSPADALVAAAPAPAEDLSVPTPLPVAGPVPLPEEVRDMIERWMSLPDAARARRAAEIAAAANRTVAAHAGDPAAAEIRERLPASLRQEATAALDDAQPLQALLYFRAYKTLGFAPPAPELEERIARIRPAEPKPARGPGP